MSHAAPLGRGAPRGVAALLLIAGLAGCDPVPSPVPAPSASALPPPPPPAVGINTPGNDPSLTAAARSTLTTCGASWRTESGFDVGCPGLKAFLTRPVERGSKDATFIAYLEDSDAKVRELGARALVTWGDGYRADRALAERVVAVAEKEKAASLLGIVGYLAGEVVLAKTGMGPRIKALLASAEAPPELQGALISILLQGNREDDAALALTRETARSGRTAMVRNAALSAYSAIYDLRPDDACAAWVENRENAEETIAANAAARLCAGASWVGHSGLAWSSTSAYPVTENRCAKEVAPTLAVIEARARAGTIANENWLSALRGVLRPDLTKTPAAQRQKALAIARVIVETKANKAGPRGSALRLLVERDPGGKAYAATFEKDPDTFLKGIALEVRAKKK